MEPLRFLYSKEKPHRGRMGPQACVIVKRLPLWGANRAGSMRDGLKRKEQSGWTRESHPEES